MIQKIDYIKGKPVIYSLGNFVFDLKRPEASEGLIVQLNLSAKGRTIIGYKINTKGCIPLITKKETIFDY